METVFTNYFRIVKKSHDLGFSQLFSTLEFQTVRSCLTIDRFCEYQQNASARDSTVFWVVIKHSFSSTEYFVAYKVPTS